MRKRTLSLVLVLCLMLVLAPQVLAASEVEGNDTFNTAQVISVNDFVKGNLVTSSDVDYYKVDLTSAGYISLTFNHDYVDSSWTYWRVTLYNEDNKELVTYGFAGNKTKSECNPIGVPAGTYYAKVSSNYHSDVPYELKLNYTQSNSWETEFNDSFSTANQISVNTAVNGSLMTSGDVDYYKVNVSSAGYISLIFSHDYVDSSWTYWKATIYDSDNQESPKLKNNRQKIFFYLTS